MTSHQAMRDQAVSDYAIDARDGKAWGRDHVLRFRLDAAHDSPTVAYWTSYAVAAGYLVKCESCSFARDDVTEYDVEGVEGWDGRHALCDECIRNAGKLMPAGATLTAVEAS